MNPLHCRVLAAQFGGVAYLGPTEEPHLRPGCVVWEDVARLNVGTGTKGTLLGPLCEQGVPAGAYCCRKDRCRFCVEGRTDVRCLSKRWYQFTKRRLLIRSLT